MIKQHIFLYIKKKATQLNSVTSSARLQRNMALVAATSVFVSLILKWQWKSVSTEIVVLSVCAQACMKSKWQTPRTR